VSRRIEASLAAPEARRPRQGKHHERRVDARPVVEFSTWRVQSINRPASGVSAQRELRNGSRLTQPRSAASLALGLAELPVQKQKCPSARSSATASQSNCVPRISASPVHNDPDVARASVHMNERKVTSARTCVAEQFRRSHRDDACEHKGASFTLQRAAKYLRVADSFACSARHFGPASACSVPPVDRVDCASALVKEAVLIKTAAARFARDLTPFRFGVSAPDANPDQRLSAVQVPEQVPPVPCPLQTPPPRSLIKRPEPLAHWLPDCSITLTAPFGVTCPCMVTMPPS
jgi:hypothetical protein